MEIRETSRYGALTSSLCITFTQLQSGQLIVHPEWRGRKIILAKKLKMSQRHKKKKKIHRNVNLITDSYNNLRPRYTSE